MSAKEPEGTELEILRDKVFHPNDSTAEPKRTENTAHQQFRIRRLETIHEERSKFRRGLEEYASELERKGKAAPLLTAAMGGHTGIGARALAMIRREPAHEQLITILAIHAEGYPDETTLLFRQGPLELQGLRDRHGRPAPQRPVMRPVENARVAQRGDAVPLAQAIPIPGGQDGKSVAERAIKRHYATPRPRLISQHAGLRDPESMREERDQGRPDPIAPEVIP